MAEVKKIENVSVDPKANIYFDGAPAFAETQWIGRDFAIGASRLQAFTMTERCEATNVDPVTAVRDLAIPRHLLRTYGHAEVGIYARVIVGGRIAPGGAIVI